MSQFRSSYAIDEIPLLVKNLFGLDTTVEKKLESYDDQNFLVYAVDRNATSVHNQRKNGYVLKILNALDSKKPKIIESQTKMIVHVSENGYPTPLPLKSVNGKYLEETSSNGTIYIVRLFEFLPATTLDKIPLTTQLCYEIGWFAGKMDKLLMTCTIPKEVTSLMQRRWNLSELPNLKAETNVIKDLEQRGVAEEIICQFEKRIVENQSSFSRGLLHSDFNECNILVEERPEAVTGANDVSTQHSSSASFPDIIKTDQSSEISKHRICGIIDFGDATYSLYLFEAAISIAYAMLNQHGIPPMDAAKNVLYGYTQHVELSDWELKHIKLAICARFVQSLVIGQTYFAQDPSNEYILIHVRRIWPVLKDLWSKSDSDVLSELTTL